ncbi:hypothetical protein [Thermogemmatispora carboxidivorans]|uniref:hypothetical protein n=1 Tax=Thermogemmatispora carboxidivorans TaxID=1382306 RepID=UPI0006994586|nr:hypothetical protein [Thermogemmatispora carboxidivorans]
MHKIVDNAPEHITQRVTDGQRIGLQMPLTGSARLLSAPECGGASEAAMTGMRGNERGRELLPEVVVGGVLLFPYLPPFFEVCQVVDEEFGTQWSRTIFLKGLKRS